MGISSWKPAAAAFSDWKRRYAISHVSVCPQEKVFAIPGRVRVVIEGVRPQIDGGRFPIKRTAGERIVVEADVFADGHDELSCCLLHRRDGSAEWNHVPMAPEGNDRWRGECVAAAPGLFVYTVQARIDQFRTWRRDLLKKAQAGQDVSVEFGTGARLLKDASRRAAGASAQQLLEAADVLTGPASDDRKFQLVQDERLSRLVDEAADEGLAERYARALQVVVDREKARCSAWYEFFPRSCATEPGRHGTFRDCEARLPYVAALGFDVLYLPPIHPIGRAHRKGKNNAVQAQPDDVGSPWAIGGKEGGHKAILPALGND